MHAIILGLIIGCSKKTDNATSANTETTSTETTSTVMPDTTTVNNVSPSNSIEIKAIVRPKDAETEKSEEEILTLPEDADNIDDTVDPD